MGKRSSPTAWALFALSGVGATGAYFLVEGTLPRELLYEGIGLSSVVAIVVGVRHFKTARPGAWYLLALGQLSFVAGDVLWLVLELRGPVPVPSVADVAYLAGYPFVAVGVLLLVRGRQPGGDRVGLIDAGIVTAGTGLALWVFLVDPYVEDHSLGLPELLTTAAYPLGDLLILGVAARLAMGPGRFPSLWLLGAGLGALLAADTVFGVLVLRDAYRTGHPVDAGWLLSYVLFGAAALHPSMEALSIPLPRPEPRHGWGRLGALAAGLLAPAALWLQARRGVDHEDALVLAGGSAVIVLLVVLRLSGLVREVQAKARALEARGR